MKKVFITLTIAVVLMQSTGFAQMIRDTVKGSVITSYRLLITTGKTTNLVFPYAIRSADRGSSDLIAQQVKGIENILQVKAAVKNFGETNLTVITADGSLFSFLVNYSPNPIDLNIRIYRDTLKQESDNNKTINKVPASFSESANNTAEIEGIAMGISKNRSKVVHGVKDKNYGISLHLNGIYIKENVLYCKFQLGNSSNVNYDVDMIRFFIQDNKRSKRTATQALEITPITIADNPAVIKAHSKSICVFAFDKFTIPDAKHFFCEVREKNGGRSLSIKIDNRHIIHAHIIGTDH